jgi:plasmid stabilization system protein ParE
VSRYTVSPKAREDLKDIYRYVARDKPAAANNRFSDVSAVPLVCLGAVLP